MPWLGPKTDMSINAGDLELDPGAQEGEYLIQDGANDYFDTGFVARWRINCIFAAQEGAVSPADDTNEIKVRLFISLNSNNPAAGPDWSPFIPYLPAHYECRYYRIKAVVKVEDAFGNLPKFIDLVPSHTNDGSLPQMAAVDDIEDEPVGTEEVGHRYLVDPSPAGIFIGHGNQIAELIDKTANVWRYFLPVKDQEVYNLANSWKYIYEGGDYAAGSWVPRGLDTTNPEKDKFTGAMTVVGAKSQLWDTDGGGDIGTLTLSRPDEIHAKSRITINGVDVVAGGGATYYQILDSTATAVDIQTALNDADTYVVFLKPGSYALGANNISIPAQKSLVGLGGVYQGTGAGADLTITVNATQRVQMADSSRLENLKLRFSSTSTAGNEMVETGTNDGCVIRGVNFDGSAVGAGNGIASQAILGRVKIVSHCEFYRCRGVYANSASDNEGGPSEISFIQYDGTIGDGSPLNSGVRSAVAMRIHDITGIGGYATVYSQGSFSFISDIYSQNTSDYGVFVTGNANHVHHVHVESGTMYGVSVAGARYTVSDIHVTNCARYGFWGNTNTECTFESIETNGCGTASFFQSIVFTAPLDCTLTGISSLDSAHGGIVVTNSLHCNMTGINSKLSSSVGILFSSFIAQSYNSLSGVQAYDNGSHGVHFQGAGSDWAISGVESWGNSGDGVRMEQVASGSLTGLTVNDNGGDGLLLSSNVNYFAISSVMAQGNGSDGIEVVAGAVGITLSSITTQGNTGNGVNGGAAGGAANNTLHGHVSHADGTNRTLGAGWNSADLW